jgi:hypothetical protein
MRLLFVMVVFAACDGSGAADRPVVELSSAEQIALCEAFLDDICANPEFASFCADPCIATGCQPAVENGEVDAECAGGITAGAVEECGATGDLAICLAGGGCMFDALEAACDGG